MCSFGSCQTRFEFLNQFRKVRNAFECFVTQVQTHLKSTLSNTQVPPRLYIQLFDILVKPIVLYACDVWGGFNVKRNPKYDSL